MNWRVRATLFVVWRVEALSEATGAGTVCGTCRPLLEELIIGLPTVSHQHKDNSPLQRSWKGLLGASLLGLLLVLLICMNGRALHTHKPVSTVKTAIRRTGDGKANSHIRHAGVATVMR